MINDSTKIARRARRVASKHQDDAARWREHWTKVHDTLLTLGEGLPLCVLKYATDCARLDMLNRLNDLGIAYEVGADEMTLITKTAMSDAKRYYAPKRKLDS